MLGDFPLFATAAAAAPTPAPARDSAAAKFIDEFSTFSKRKFSIASTKREPPL